MPRSTFDLYNQLTRGQLEGRLRTMRQNGMTYRQIAQKLRPKIVVDQSTVFRWCRELGIDGAKVDQ